MSSFSDLPRSTYGEERLAKQMAALGGFASKMGPATGPFAAGLLLGDDNYARLINIAVFALIVALIASVIPAIKHDRIATSRA